MHETARAALPHMLRETLSAALRARVQALHVEAERSGIVADILHRRANRAGYALLLRNLLPAYRALEQGLERHRASPVLQDLARPALYRATAIAADLTALHGPDWPELPLLEAARHYGERVEAVTQGGGERLIAHAYARYMGDLSGGQIMRRMLAGSMGLQTEALSFHAFEAIGDPGAFKTAYRDAIDRAGRHLVDPGTVIEEAAVAFALNIDLSQAVQEAMARPC